MVHIMANNDKSFFGKPFWLFWKMHIPRHAGKGPIVGQWILRELREHGYNVSLGTLYPLLRRMEAHGWLRSVADPTKGSRARKEYQLISEGRRVLRRLRLQVGEMYEEISEEHDRHND